MSVTFTGVTSQLTAFVASQDAVVDATKKSIALGVSAIASILLRGLKFGGLFVVGGDLWPMEEVMDGCDVD